MVDYSFGAVQDGSITEAKLANNAVTSQKIAVDTILAEDIATGAVQAVEIAVGIITDAKIAVGAAIAKAKLAALGIVDADVTGISASKIDAGLLALARGGLAFAPVLAGNTLKVIRVNAGETALELATGGGATVTNQEDVMTADETTTSTTYVSTTLSITVANRTGGKWMAIAPLTIRHSNTVGPHLVNLFDDGVALAADQKFNNDVDAEAVSIDKPQMLAKTGNLDGSVIDVRFSTASGTATIRFIADQAESHLSILEVS